MSSKLDVNEVTNVKRTMHRTDPRTVAPIDLILTEADMCQIEVQDREDNAKMVYLNLNGVTIARVSVKRLNVQLCGMSLESSDV